VYYDTNFLDGFLSSIGDMAPAFVIAHELGHHVSNLRGFVRPVHSQKQVELQADCFAGAWTADVDSRGLLETGDLEEAVRILVVGGDSANTWFLPNAHGTSAQRVAAATMGYQMGSSTCTAPDFLRTIPSAALSYSGSQFVEAPDHTDLDLGNTWTIEAWVAPMDPTVPTTQALISKGTWQTVGDAAYSLVRNFDGRLFVITSNGVSQSIVESSTTLVANAWNHLAVTFDNGTVTTYINGAVQSEAGAVVPINASGPLTFGRIGPSPSFLAVAPFTGLIDEVRMWNIVRSQTEIATTRNELVTPSEPGLVGYWRFNVGFEDVAYDATERGHNGRLGSLVGPDINDPQWDVGAPLPAASRSSR
jgi:hypothetical protein